MADDGRQQRKPDFKTAVEDVTAIATVFTREAESILGRRTSRFLGVLVLFAVVVGVLLALLDWYIAPSGAEQKQALVVTLAQILGGAALLSGLYFTWRTLQVNREGQITERFTRAIDQLGSDKLESKIGGIYALEQIAKTSEKDYWPIIRVLTTYVREHAPWPPQEQSVEDPYPEPDADVAAILDVLSKRNRYYGKGEFENLDLGETDLRRGILLAAHLEEANLAGSNLEQAMLTKAKLDRAYLYKTNLKGADLQLTDLTEAVLEGSILRGANFRGAIGLTQAQLEETMGDEHTVFPLHLKPPARWNVKTGEQIEGK